MGNLLLPPAAVWGLLLLGAVLGRRRSRPGRALVLAALLLLYALSTPLVGDALLRSLEDPAQAFAPPGDAAAQAIVVLAAGRTDAAPEYGGSTVDRLTLERLRYAARLHRLTGLPVLTCGGALRGEAESLAGLMRSVLQDDFAVPVAWTEDASRTTWENATGAAALLLPQGVLRVHLVTHAWHLPRAAGAFARAGFVVLPAGTGFTRPLDWAQVTPGDLLPQAGPLLNSYYAAHEWLGIAWYRLRAAW